jgi:hypothetical protein
MHRHEPDMNRQSRFFAFTWNNPPEDAALYLQQLWDALGGPGNQIQYMIAGYETGPHAQRPHIQGFFHLHPRGRWRIRQAKQYLDQFLPGGVYVSPTQASADENVEYCKKDGNWLEFGVRDVREEREDRFAAALRMAQEGNVQEIPADIRIRHHRALQEISEALPPAPFMLDHPTGIWIWGPVGVGKSTVTRQTLSKTEGGFFLKNATMWWCGYRGQPHVLWDEANPTDLRRNCTMLKEWADRFAVTVEKKHGSFNIRPETIIVVSNWNPWGVFKGTDLAAIMKRFTVVEFNNQHPIDEARVTNLIHFTMNPTEPLTPWMTDNPHILLFSGHPKSLTPLGEELHSGSLGKYGKPPEAKPGRPPAARQYPPDPPQATANPYFLGPADVHAHAAPLESRGLGAGGRPAKRQRTPDGTLADPLEID